MPTPTRGVPIMLDKERHLRFSLKTTKEMRNEFGGEALEKGVSQDSIARLLLFGLKWEDPELTMDQVEEMVDLEHLSEVVAAVQKATGQRAQIKEVAADETDASKLVAVAVETEDPPQPPVEEPTPPDAGSSKETAVEEEETTAEES